MIDASTQPLEENIALTRRAVDICGECGVFVEGELGHVGGVADEKMSDFTDVAQAPALCPGDRRGRYGGDGGHRPRRLQKGSRAGYSPYSGPFAKPPDCP